MIRVPSGRAVDVWWFDARALTPGPAELAWLDAGEKARAGALAFAADRRRYLAAHVLLRTVLAGYAGTGPGALVFGRAPCPRCAGPSGRPVLLAGAGAAGSGTSSPAPGPPPATTPCFSLAHSGEAVVIAVAGSPVGVDVERDPARCVCSLADTAHPADAAIMAGSAAPGRHAVIIGWWVRAEAVLKCRGEGIAHGLDGFPVLTAGGAGHGSSCLPLAAPPGYQAAVALAGHGAIGRVAARGQRPW